MPLLEWFERRIFDGLDKTTKAYKNENGSESTKVMMKNTAESELDIKVNGTRPERIKSLKYMYLDLPSLMTAPNHRFCLGFLKHLRHKQN